VHAVMTVLLVVLVYRRVFGLQLRWRA
jgi:hypothetical protein